MNKKRFFRLAGTAAAKAQQDKTFTTKVKTTFRMLNDIVRGTYKPTWKNIILPFLAFIYILSPLDFIPSFMFGPIGLIDDFGILMFGLKFLNKEIEKYLAWEILQPKYSYVEDAKIID